MAITLPSPRAIETTPEHESYLHLLAREFRAVLRWTVLVSGIVTVVSMFTIFYWAILPALVLLISCCLLGLANEVERRTPGPHDDPIEQAIAAAEQAAADAEADPVQREKKAVNKAVDGKVTTTVTEILIGAAVLAVILGAVVAWIFIGWQMLALGAMILFAYILFVGAPVWLGWIEDEAEETQHRVEHELHSE